MTKDMVPLELDPGMQSDRTITLQAKAAHEAVPLQLEMTVRVFPNQKKGGAAPLPALRSVLLPATDFSPPLGSKER